MHITKIIKSTTYTYMIFKKLLALIQVATLSSLPNDE